MAIGDTPFRLLHHRTIFCLAAFTRIAQGARVEPRHRWRSTPMTCVLGQLQRLVTRNHSSPNMIHMFF